MYQSRFGTLNIPLVLLEAYKNLWVKQQIVEFEEPVGKKQIVEFKELVGKQECEVVCRRQHVAFIVFLVVGKVAEFVVVSNFEELVLDSELQG